ncbi:MULTISPECIES: hypothetical protein [Bacillus cereus group]|uniref:Group-specific protein n=2 Tax=Bacillus cereus group TaxID=86661 RepID=A0A2C1DLU7_BACCE|nr:MULTISPECIES: hypothetical protein [Bacillus cereus group]OFD80081.1 hypothetical protein BWGOE9_20200 [Bacillus mycoides]OFD80647.1 hypothetical protein BWGOE8_20150 [Bacillus mycoides]OFD83366.1 hypothetical protein BWGOE10_20330 [Bacillus mycoides]PGT00640.1 hypothetical protein COD09_15455 [Bacillus cereus]
MWNIKEEDLDKFRVTCQSRLSPEGATGFMLGTIFYISIFMFVIFVGGLDYYNNLFDRIIVKTEIVLYIVQIIFLIIYLFPKVCFKFQKLQTLIILLYAFQLGTILFSVSVVSEMADNSIARIYTGLLFLGAVIVHIVATMDTFKQASEGAFSSDERSTSFFSKTKGAMIKGAIIYVLILIILMYFQNDYSIDFFVMYGVGTVLIYAVAIGAAEFQLLAYCRFKFKSFNMTWEENERMRGRFRKQNKKFKTKNK